MSEVATPRTAGSLKELVDAVELRQIVTYKLYAERIPTGVERIEDGKMEMEAKVRSDEAQLETRFEARLEAPNAVYVADIGAIYEFLEPIDVSQELIGAFIGEVGVMAAFPYLREAIAGLATRLGAEVPTLGLMRRGDMSFGVEPSELDSDQAKQLDQQPLEA